MQKSIIAVAVAAALTAPALALADSNNVIVYGKANASLDIVDSGTAAAGTAGTRSYRISSNVSRLGFKGSEDLGSDLKVVWQIEQEIDLTGAKNGTSALATRNTFVGLSNPSLGTVLLGRHDTPYKIATRKIDQFGDGIADNRSLMGGVSKLSAVASFDGRQPDVIAYISPSLSGFTGAIAHVNLNQAKNLSQAFATDLKAKAWSLAGMYKTGPFYASLAYEVHDIGAGTTPVATTAGKEKATKLGLSYSQDAFTVGLAYERTSDNFGGNAAAVALGSATCGALAAGANCFGHNAWYLGGKYNLTASDAIKLGYTKMGKTAGMAAGTTDAASQYTVGYDHNMSKRTAVYALYSKLNNGVNGSFGLSHNASSVNSTGALNALAGAGADPSVVSFGIRHTF